MTDRRSPPPSSVPQLKTYVLKETLERPLRMEGDQYPAPSKNITIHWGGRPEPPPLGGLPPPPEPGGKPCPPLPLPLPPEPDDELPPFRFWFGPVGNGPCVLPLPLPPDDELPPFRFWFGPVGNEPFVLLPPPRAIAPETGASRAMPAVAIVTPSIMLSRLVIIVAPFATLSSKPYPAARTIAISGSVSI